MASVEQPTYGVAGWVAETLALEIGVTWTGVVTLGVKPELGWRYRRLRQE